MYLHLLYKIKNAQPKLRQKTQLWLLAKTKVQSY